jgi:hypothetical protein
MTLSLKGHNLKRLACFLKRNTKSFIHEQQRATDRECEIFGRYLVSQRPTDYIRGQYELAVRVRNLANEAELAAFDRRTLGFACRCVFFTRVADAYCAIFHRHGVLRRKLILLLAILEHAPPTASRFDRPKNRGPVGVATNLLLLWVNFVLLLLLGIFLLSPYHFLGEGRRNRPLEESGK